MNSLLPHQLRTLPPLPYVAHEVLVAVNDTDASLTHIARALAREPGLAARVVSMANSAFYADQRAIHSIEEAVVRLGLNRVRVLAASILLAQQFDTSACRPFRMDRYWHAAVATAFCAARVSRCLSSADVAEDVAYLAGLLHNIGLLLLVHVFPKEMSVVLAAANDGGRGSLPALAQEELGIDHHAAGALLLSEWGMSKEVVVVARHVNDRLYDGPASEVAAMIRVCAEWAETGFSSLPVEAETMIPAQHLNAVGAACRREQEHLEAFARLLGGG